MVFIAHSDLNCNAGQTLLGTFLHQLTLHCNPPPFLGWMNVCVRHCPAVGTKYLLLVVAGLMKLTDRERNISLYV